MNVTTTRAARAALGAWMALLVLGTSDLGAQVGGSEGPAVSHAGSFSILGSPPERRRIIPGLFALHPFDPKFPEMAWTRGGGIQASTWFAAGFMNSYERFSLIAGVERNWWQHEAVGATLGVGYRVGLLTGYDRRLLQIADQLPALPVGGLLVWMDLGRVAVDTFYVYRALTVEGSFPF